MARAIVINHHGPTSHQEAVYTVSSGSLRRVYKASELGNVDAEKAYTAAANLFATDHGWNPAFLTEAACIEGGMWVAIWEPLLVAGEVGWDAPTDRQGDIFVSRPFGRFSGLNEVADIQLRDLKNGEWRTRATIKLGSTWTMTISMVEALLEARGIPMGDERMRKFTDKVWNLLKKAPYA